MALDVIHALFEELDYHTPCITKEGNLARKQEENHDRLLLLVRKILSTSFVRFNKSQHLAVVDALRFAAMHHKGVRRHDKVTPYFLHVIEVTCILIDLGVYDFNIFVSAIIHDVVEDTEVKIKEVKTQFGVSISRIVDLLTKHPNFIRKKFYWVRIRNETNLHILWRVIVIKFADRIHNLMTLDSVPLEKRKRKISETKKEFPELYKVLVKALHKLRSKEILTKDKHMQLPFRLNNRLVYEMGRFETLT
jgi:(p)ppGpp synthase/HD superfamily hydrolase